ncbi:hypothetical protein GQ55_9G389500 [Panicum hallii var. hallii]|uniref:Uncharacterized protein n=1 Tax=Panicum hallii var. hallii TaxID=1504633 RepID=A0A2T7C9J2_9POAL|nr:hypothetical protein GQ55_9G389500 [Panicum hallii var. hallii]
MATSKDLLLVLTYSYSYSYWSPHLRAQPQQRLRPLHHRPHQRGCWGLYPRPLQPGRWSSPRSSPRQGSRDRRWARGAVRGRAPAVLAVSRASRGRRAPTASRGSAPAAPRATAGPCDSSWSRVGVWWPRLRLDPPAPCRHRRVWMDRVGRGEETEMPVVQPYLLARARRRNLAGGTKAACIVCVMAAAALMFVSLVISVDLNSCMRYFG